MAFLDLGQYRPRNSYHPLTNKLERRIRSINWTFVAACVISGLAWFVIVIGILELIGKLGWI